MGNVEMPSVVVLIVVAPFEADVKAPNCKSSFLKFYFKNEKLGKT
jgi:hypothetical protein